jgi:hypothetical protein
MIRSERHYRHCPSLPVINDGVHLLGGAVISVINPFRGNDAMTPQHDGQMMTAGWPDGDGQAMTLDRICRGWMTVRRHWEREDCERRSCANPVTVTGNGYGWCEEHATAADVVALGERVGWPFVRLPWGQGIGPGLPVYAAQAASWSEHDRRGVVIVLRAMTQEYC